MFTDVFSPFPSLVSPRFFFLCGFFSRALLSERLEQANLTEEVGVDIKSRGGQGQVHYARKFEPYAFEGYPQNNGIMLKIMLEKQLMLD